MARQAVGSQMRVFGEGKYHQGRGITVGIYLIPPDVGLALHSRVAINRPKGLAIF